MRVILNRRNTLLSTWLGAGCGCGGLGFVWLCTTTSRLKHMQLFEGPVIGAVESAFVADYQ